MSKQDQSHPEHSPLNDASSTADHHLAEPISVMELFHVLAAHRVALFGLPLVAGALALGITFLMKPVYTAKTVFLPPQQQQSAAASALASLGALSGLAGVAGGIKTPGDQYVALMQSRNVERRIVERFDLQKVYKQEFLFKTYEQLESNVRIGLGKKDGLIAVEADATDPQLAADIANQYVAELQRLSGELALTEVQQRRMLFEAEVKRAREKLSIAQTALQNSGFSPEALKAEPKATAEIYAKLNATMTAAGVQLQAMRRSFAEGSPEIQQQLATVDALRIELSKLSAASQPVADANYLGRYREFKYQEALLETFTKQYELARLDESREGALIQVVDVATKPEWKSRPKRGLTAVMTTVAAFLLLVASILIRHSFRKSMSRVERT